MKNINKEFIEKAYNCLIKFQGDALQLRILQTPYSKLNDFEKEIKNILLSSRSKKGSNISKEEIEKDFNVLVDCINYLEKLKFITDIFVEYIDLVRPVSFDTFLTSEYDESTIKKIKEFLTNNEQECVDY